MIDFHYRDFMADLRLSLFDYIDSFRRLLKARDGVHKLLNRQVLNEEMLRTEVVFQRDIDEVYDLIMPEKNVGKN